MMYAVDPPGISSKLADLTASSINGSGLTEQEEATDPEEESDTDVENCDDNEKEANEEVNKNDTGESKSANKTGSEDVKEMVPKSTCTGCRGCNSSGYKFPTCTNETLQCEPLIRCGLNEDSSKESNIPPVSPSMFQANPESIQ